MVNGYVGITPERIPKNRRECGKLTPYQVLTGCRPAPRLATGGLRFALSFRPSLTGIPAIVRRPPVAALASYRRFRYHSRAGRQKGTIMAEPEPFDFGGPNSYKQLNWKNPPPPTIEQKILYDQLRGATQNVIIFTIPLLVLAIIAGIFWSKWAFLLIILGVPLIYFIPKTLNDLHREFTAPLTLATHTIIFEPLYRNEDKFQVEVAFELPVSWNTPYIQKRIDTSLRSYLATVFSTATTVPGFDIISKWINCDLIVTNDELRIPILRYHIMRVQNARAVSDDGVFIGS